MDRPTIFARHPSIAAGRRPRRGLVPQAVPLEDRRLLTGSSAVTATMTQTATFPDLESMPTVADQALLYFGATMGTLTEVDVTTSGSFQSQFSAENLAPTAGTITGTTAGNLSINVPTGAVPVAIPAVSQGFRASAFDGTADDAGTSGHTFAATTSRSTPQTMVLTSPADLAAFTGFARMPIGVAGHATGSVSATTGDVSDAFRTQTSATITVVYHYIPNLTRTPPAPTSPPPATSPPPPAGTGTPTTAAPIGSTGTAPSQAATGTGGGAAATLTTATHRRARAFHRPGLHAPAAAGHHRKPLVRAGHRRP